MRRTYAQIHWMRIAILKKEEDNRRHGRMLKRKTNEQKKKTRDWDQWWMRENTVTKPEEMKLTLEAGSLLRLQSLLVNGVQKERRNEERKRENSTRTVSSWSGCVWPHNARTVLKVDNIVSNANSSSTI